VGVFDGVNVIVGVLVSVGVRDGVLVLLGVTVDVRVRVFVKVGLGKKDGSKQEGIESFLPSGSCVKPF